MIDRRTFLKSSSLAIAGSAISVKSIAAKKDPSRHTNVQEWRNKQSDMSYRQLGNTGFMVSEFVNGGDPVSRSNTHAVEVAMERGLNYLDMAPAYGNGECEKGYAKIIDSSSKREEFLEQDSEESVSHTNTYNLKHMQTTRTGTKARSLAGTWNQKHQSWQQPSSAMMLYTSPFQLSAFCLMSAACFRIVSASS